MEYRVEHPTCASYPLFRGANSRPRRFSFYKIEEFLQYLSLEVLLWIHLSSSNTSADLSDSEDCKPDLRCLNGNRATRWAADRIRNGPQKVTHRVLSTCSLSGPGGALSIVTATGCSKVSLNTSHILPNTRKRGIPAVTGTFVDLCFLSLLALNIFFCRGLWVAVNAGVEISF